jgi:hypothetical protein
MPSILSLKIDLVGRKVDKVVLTDFRRKFLGQPAHGWAPLRRQGAGANHQRVRRLWRQHGFSMRIRRRRKRGDLPSHSPSEAAGPHAIWAYETYSLICIISAEPGIGCCQVHKLLRVCCSGNSLGAARCLLAPRVVHRQSPLHGLTHTWPLLVRTERDWHRMCSSPEYSASGLCRRRRGPVPAMRAKPSLFG